MHVKSKDHCLGCEALGPHASRVPFDAVCIAAIIVGVLLVQMQVFTLAAYGAQPSSPPNKAALQGAVADYAGGQSLLRAHEYAKAMASFKKALAVTTENCDTVLKMAECLDRMGRYSEALPYCVKAHELRAARLLDIPPLSRSAAASRTVRRVHSKLRKGNSDQPEGAVGLHYFSLRI